MRCPKCNHEQNNAVECDVCGVIFARYQKILDRRKEEEEKESPVVEKSGSGLKILQLLLLVVVVASTTYYFTGNKSSPEPAQQPKPSASVAQAPTSAVAGAPVAPVQRKMERMPERQEPPAPAFSGNVIERARNATVSIETPSGTGSGFFVNNRYIVTNRHVVQLDEKSRDELRTKVERDGRMIELERQKINDLKMNFQKYDKASRNQLKIFIEESEERLQKFLPLHEEEKRKLAKMEQKIRASDIKIIFADGKSSSANYLDVSPKLDLALLSLYTEDRPFLEKPPTKGDMHQGDKVYAIGSPVGLRHTVTSGIFSGYRSLEKDGPVYLQTDAAINPGNSGGPIIDEKGYARGVATLVFRNTEGIGFAIPIEKVFEEFSSTLR
jgi:serine protease Do